MSAMNGPKALHVATFSGWYRFEQNGKEFTQTRRDLSYWTLLVCPSTRKIRKRSMPAPSIRDCSTARMAAPIGIAPSRRCRNVSLLGIGAQRRVMVGTIPSAVYRSKNGGWEELEGVRLHSAGANFLPVRNCNRAHATWPTIPTPQSPLRRYRSRRHGAERRWRPRLGALQRRSNRYGRARDPRVKQHSGMVFLACGEACFRSPDRDGHWENISPQQHDYGISVAEDKKASSMSAPRAGGRICSSAKKAPDRRSCAAATRGRPGDGRRQFERRRYAFVRDSGRQRHGRRYFGWYITFG